MNQLDEQRIREIVREELKKESSVRITPQDVQNMIKITCSPSISFVRGEIEKATDKAMATQINEEEFFDFDQAIENCISRIQKAALIALKESARN